MKHFDPIVDIQVDSNSKGPITCQRRRHGRRATRNENKDDEGSREFSPEFTRNIYWPNVCLRIRATTFRRAGWLALSLGGDIKDFRGTNVNTEWWCYKVAQIKRTKLTLVTLKGVPMLTRFTVESIDSFSGFNFGIPTNVNGRAKVLRRGLNLRIRQVTTIKY